MIFVLFLIFVIIVLIAMMFCMRYESNCRIKQWKGRYFNAKDRAKKFEKRAEALECQMKCDIEEKDLMIAELKEKYKKLQERSCEKDIENQKKGE